MELAKRKTAHGATLCIAHFLTFAEENLVETSPMHISPPDRRDTAKKEPPQPARVQPRRAARTKTTPYAETHTRKRKLADADMGVHSGRVTKRKVKHEIGKLKSKIDAVVGPIDTEGDCPFGAKPWVCWWCEEAVAPRKMGTMTAVMTTGAPGPTIEPDQGVSLLLDWKGIPVTKERVFFWRDKAWAVDGCDKTMVLMLDESFDRGRERTP